MCWKEHYFTTMTEVKERKQARAKELEQQAEVEKMKKAQFATLSIHDPGIIRSSSSSSGNRFANYNKPQQSQPLHERLAKKASILSKANKSTSIASMMQKR